MSRKSITINNFSAGEWSPFLDARADLQKYENACLTLENFRPLPWGGATYRQGTVFAGFTKSAASPVRLIPFNYSTSLSYMIEMGDLYMRFWNSDGTQVVVSSASNWVVSTTYPVGSYVKSVTDSLIYYCYNTDTSSTTDPGFGNNPTHWIQQTIMEVPSPYTAADLKKLQYKQINAQVRFTHPSYAPQTLVYSSATSWSMGATAFKYPPLLNQNAVQSILLNVSATSGSTTLVSNTAGTFNANHVGSYWELQHLRASASSILDLNNQSVGVQVFSTPITIEGDWTFTTSQFWWGVVQVLRSVDGGSTYTVIREFTAKSDQNYSTSGTESPPNIGSPAVLYKIGYTMSGAPFDSAVWVGSAPSQYAYAQASLESQDAYIAGLVKVTGYTDSQHVSCTVIISPVSTATTYLWSEGAFSTYRGFPQAIAFYEQRLLYSGTSYLPNTVWGSVTGDFDNFQYSDNDDGAVAFQPAVTQQNQTAWLASLLRVHVGTSGEEIIMASGNLDEALTPSNITMRAQSYYGSAPIQPLLLQNSILFIERNGLRVREMRELSPYVVPTDFIAPDLTLLAEHITQPGLVYMDFGRLPDPLGYFVRSDGVLAVMTYNREQNINAWARYTTNGLYESVACIYGTPADEVWVSCYRTFNGVAKRTIEIFTTDPASFPNQATNVMLDCATQKTVGVGAKQVTGLTYLANVTGLTMTLDGAEYTGLTVDGSGVLAFPANVTAKNFTSYVNVGFPYVGNLVPMKPVMQDQEGSSQGRKVRIAEIVLRVRSSASVEFSGGVNPAVYYEYPFRSTGDKIGSPTALNNSTGNGVGDFVLPGPWPDGNSFSGQINLRQTHPWPLTILGIFVKFDVF